MLKKHSFSPLWWFSIYAIPFFALKILEVMSPKSTGEGLEPSSQHAQEPVKEKDGSGH